MPLEPCIVAYHKSELGGRNIYYRFFIVQSFDYFETPGLAGPPNPQFLLYLKPRGGKIRHVSSVLA